MPVSRPGRSSVRYWRDRLIRNSRPGPNGTRIEASVYSVRIHAHGERRYVSLHTSDRTRAAERARDAYEQIQAEGWATLEMDKPAEHAADTIGNFLKAVRSTADLSDKTWKGYSSSLRLIASQIAGIDGEDRYRPGGTWRERVDELPLSILTSAAIQRWKLSYVKSGNPDPETRRRRQTSCNSYLRCARSLWAGKVIRHLPDHLCKENPFNGIDLWPRQSHRYVSRVNAEALLNSASEELPEEQLKIFCLALLAGLRKREIDVLTWDLIDLNQGQIELRPTRYLKLKSECSAGIIPLDESLQAALRGWQEKSEGEFVIRAVAEDAADGYRCQRIFELLYAWLREHGLTDRKPLHALRKEYGSILCKRHGIHVASRLLRHADLATTAGHYVADPAGPELTTGLRLRRREAM